MPYDPETVNTFELGVKSEWFNQRLRLNAVQFSSAYDDFTGNLFGETDSNAI